MPTTYNQYGSYTPRYGQEQQASAYDDQDEQRRQRLLAQQQAQQSAQQFDRHQDGAAVPQQLAQTTQQQTQQQANPWAQYGIDPTRPVPAGMAGTREQALAGIQYAAQARLGRQLSQEQLNQLAAAIGYSGSGNISSEQYNNALSWLAGQQGNPNAPAQGPQVNPATGLYNATPGSPTGGYAEGVSPMQASPWGVAAPAPYQPGGSAPATRLAAALPPFMRVPAPQFTQFNAPNQQGTDDRMTSLLNRVLDNPETMGADAVNQMRSQARDTAVSRSQELRDQARADRANRGFSDLGGTAAAAEAAIDTDLIDNLINSDRALDIQARTQNRQDVLQALGIADATLSGQLGRARDAYGTRLMGEQTQADSDFRRDEQGEGARRFDAEFGEGQRQYDSDADLRRFMADEGLSAQAADSRFRNAEFEFGQNRDNRQFNLNEWLAREGTNLDRARLGEQRNQFRTATGLDLLRLLEGRRQFDTSFGEDQRQFNNRLGFDYTGLGVGAQDNLMRQLMTLFGDN